VCIALVLIQDALVAAIEEMRVMRSKVEEAEAAAQQAKKAALTGGLDVMVCSSFFLSLDIRCDKTPV
jgi:hypothetical protein